MAMRSFLTRAATARPALAGSFAAARAAPALSAASTRLMSTRLTTAQAEKLTQIGTRRIFGEGESRLRFVWTWGLWQGVGIRARRLLLTHGCVAHRCILSAMSLSHADCALRHAPSDHDIFRESCRRFYEEEVVPDHDKWEEQGHVPRELWQAAGASGLLGITMPEEYGGVGADILYAAINWEEQSYTGCTGPGWALHSEICMPCECPVPCWVPCAVYVPASSCAVGRCRHTR